MKWIQNPAVAGDAGKHYVPDAKAAVYTSTARPAGTRWTETTAPAGWVPPLIPDLVTGTELATAITAHDQDSGAHPDIRELIDSLDVGSGGVARPRGFHHEQISALSTWTVFHELGFKPAGVVARDATGLIEPAGIAYLDTDTCVLSWSAPVAGSVDLS